MCNYAIEVAHKAFGGDGKVIAYVYARADTPEAALEYAYRVTNTIDKAWFDADVRKNRLVYLTDVGRGRLASRGGLRSTSVGDVMWLNIVDNIPVEPVGYEVDHAGFKLLEESK